MEYYILEWRTENGSQKEASIVPEGWVNKDQKTLIWYLKSRLTSESYPPA